MGYIFKNTNLRVEKSQSNFRYQFTCIKTILLKGAKEAELRNLAGGLLFMW